MTIDFTDGRQSNTIDPKFAAQVAIVERVPATEEGAADELITTIFDLPAGSKTFTTQPRMCGDWYVQIDLANKRAFCAVGAEKADALAACIAKVPA